MKKFITLLLLLLSACSNFKLGKNIILDESNWVQYGNSPENLNVAYFNISPPLQLAWTYNAGAGFSYSPMLAADGLLFIGTLGEEIHIVDIETGKRIGIIKAGSPISGTPILYKNKLIIPTTYSKNTLQSLDLNLGKVLWKEKLGQIEASPLLIHDNIIVPTLEGHVINYSIKYDTPQKIWEFKAPKPIRSSPASDGKFVVFGCDDENVYCVELETGSSLWKFNAGASVFAPISISDGKAFFGSLNGFFYALDLKTGNAIWKFESGSKIYGGCSINDSLVIFGTASGKLFALNKNNGEIAWKFSAKSVINSAPVISSKFIFFGSLDKNIYILDSTNGNLIWQYETEGRIKSSPIIWKNFLIVASEDRLIYAFKTQNKQAK